MLSGDFHSMCSVICLEDVSILKKCNIFKVKDRRIGSISVAKDQRNYHHMSSVANIFVYIVQ